ncbi:efflux RND transporter periplasmic adaptor subunit [Microbulbifer sp. TYP-18]|uniref:efflux RND transporter periplasmic adaptor subunit n=1 Tax=Microbulbifer sp. TYP-18 TaxID=3230024 RepID=UPI0034C6B541
MPLNTLRRRRQCALLVSLLALCACQPPADPEVVDFKVPVNVSEVQVSTVQEVLKTTGTVRAPEVISLTVLTPGLLQLGIGENGRLAEGDSVKAGDVVASVTGEEVRLAAALQVAREKLSVARKNLEVTSSLYDKKLVTVEDYGRAKTVYEDAKLAYEQSIHIDSRNQIVTPIDGVILSLVRDRQDRVMADGQMLDAGQVVAQIAPLDTLVVDIDLVSRDIGRVHPGLEAWASYHAWPEQKFSGRVLRMAPTLDERTRALRAEVAIDNQAGLMRPGMFVEVSVVVEQRENVPVVPRQALAQRGGRRVVFVVEGGRAIRREVELGIGDDHVVEVIKGVSAGDRVVSFGLETLADQMPVRVVGN